MKKRRIKPYKKYIGAFTPSWLMERPELNGNSKLLYGQLAKYSGEDGLCFPKVESLCKDLGISKSSVIRCIQELEKYELIERDRTLGGSVTVYYFLEHEWAEDTINDTDKVSEKPRCQDETQGIKMTPSRCQDDTFKVSKRDSHIRNKKNHLKEYLNSEKKSENSEDTEVSESQDVFEKKTYVADHALFKGKGGMDFWVTIPEALQDQQFCDLYQEYLNHYADQYKRYKSVMMVEKDFIELARLKSRGNDIIEVINRTIRSGGYEFYDLPKKDEPVKEVRGSGPNWGLM